jgi:hypothetical protein
MSGGADHQKEPSTSHPQSFFYTLFSKLFFQGSLEGGKKKKIILQLLERLIGK